MTSFTPGQSGSGNGSVHVNFEESLQQRIEQNRLNRNEVDLHTFTEKEAIAWIDSNMNTIQETLRWYPAYLIITGLGTNALYKAELISALEKHIAENYKVLHDLSITRMYKDGALEIRHDYSVKRDHCDSAVVKIDDETPNVPAYSNTTYNSLLFLALLFCANADSTTYDVKLVETALNELLALKADLWEPTPRVATAATNDPPPSSTSSARTLLWRNFLHEMAEIGSSACAKEMIRTVDVAANAMTAVALCKKKNEIKKAPCSNHWLRDREWALRILDAWGRLPAGLHSSGPFLWLGAYDQCLDVVVPVRANGSASYCLIDANVADSQHGRKVNIRYGMCLPPPCNETDVLNMASGAVRITSRIFGLVIHPMPKVQCQSRTKPITTGQRDRVVSRAVTVGILASLVLLVVLGTVVDVHRSRLEALLNEKKTDNEDYPAAFGRSGRRQRRSSVQSEVDSFVLTYKSAPAIKSSITQRSVIIHILRAFSARLSWRRIFRPVSNRKARIPCLNGMRIVAALWVVVGHSHLMIMPVIGNLRHVAIGLNKTVFGELLLNASLAVDTFLLLSGTLVSFAVNRRLACSTTAGKRFWGIGRWLAFYGHRLVRLIPLYALVLAVQYSWYNELGDGPLWNKWIFGSRCEVDDWWRHLFMISNYFATECMPWMWFLALDWQFYLISPLFLILLNKWPKVGVAVIVGGIIASTVYRMAIYYAYELPHNILLAMLKNEELATESAKQMFTLLYAAPQARIGPFLIGILLGWLLVNHRTNQYNGRRWVPVWAMKLGSMTALMYSLFGGYFIEEQDSASGFIYGAVFRTTWAMGLAMLIWQCQMGEMRAVQAVLGWCGWTPPARLGFGVYLIHEPLVLWFVWTQRTALMPHSMMHFMPFAIAIAALSWLLAIPMAVFVEAPPLTLERLLFKTVRRIQSHLQRQRTISGNSLPMPRISAKLRTVEWIKSPDRKLSEVVCDRTVVVHRPFPYSSTYSNASEETSVEMPLSLTEPFSRGNAQLDDEPSTAPYDPSIVVYHL
uniref:Nose resistant-to-fluoxetine protein N-terminal domain-containing protein n=1 Tax=Plectus sambesii TaxID=2011161 RepID=A0A914VJY9_9BILA